MRVVTTIHLDRTSSPDDFHRAAEQWQRAIEQGGTKVPNAVSLWVDQWRGIMSRATAPFEFRLGSMDSEPLVVVHPGTRAEGEALKAKAIKDGDWVTDAYKGKA